MGFSSLLNYVVWLIAGKVKMVLVLTRGKMPRPNTRKELDYAMITRKEITLSIITRKDGTFLLRLMLFSNTCVKWKIVPTIIYKTQVARSDLGGRDRCPRLSLSPFRFHRVVELLDEVGEQGASYSRPSPSPLKSKI